VELRAMAGNQRGSLGPGLLDELDYRSVELRPGFLGITTGLDQIATEKHVARGVVEMDRANTFHHAPRTYHQARQLGGTLQIVLRAGGWLVKHNLLRRSAPEQHR